MENNKKSGKYSNEDVLKVVSKLPEVERDNLLETLTVADISKLMNDKTECDNFCDYIEKIVVKYSLLADAVRMLNENMDAMLLDDARETIADMISKYKKFSRNERLEFNKKIQDENDLTDSLNLFKHTWDNFMNKLCGAV